MVKLESVIQHELIEKLYERFPLCYVLKNDSSYRQGIPDLLFLYEGRWAMLECKRSKSSRLRPNQQYFIDMFNNDLGGYARIVTPENMEDVLNEMENIFKS